MITLLVTIRFYDRVCPISFTRRAQDSLLILIFTDFSAFLGFIFYAIGSYKNRKISGFVIEKIKNPSLAYTVDGHLNLKSGHFSRISLFSILINFSEILIFIRSQENNHQLFVLKKNEDSYRLLSKLALCFTR